MAPGANEAAASSRNAAPAYTTCNAATWRPWSRALLRPLHPLHVEGRPAPGELGAAANGAGTLVGGHRRLHRSDGSLLNYQVGVSACRVCRRARQSVKVPGPGPRPWPPSSAARCFTGTGAAMNSAQVRLGSTGGRDRTGRRGLRSCSAPLAAGAREVVAIDTLPEKLEMAMALGRPACRADDPDVVPACGPRCRVAPRWPSRRPVRCRPWNPLPGSPAAAAPR